MKKERLVGILLLVLAVFTGIGMALQDDGYWQIYNYATLLFSVAGGVALLRGK